MLTGTRRGHHAKVTPDPLQPPSKEASPPHDTHHTHGRQRARRLAAPAGLPLRANPPVWAPAGVEGWSQVGDFRERWLHECPK